MRLGTTTLSVTQPGRRRAAGVALPGGGGGLVYIENFPVIGGATYPISVGAGGSSANQEGEQGGDSVFTSPTHTPFGTSITGEGGGGGGGYPGDTQGFTGGSGGGGGVGEAGENANPPSVSAPRTAGAGGDGLPISWMPASYGTTGPSAGRWFAGGGGGGTWGNTGGPGGAGGRPLYTSCAADE